MITEKFEVPLYVKFTTLWPSCSGTSHGMIQQYDFIIGTANNKNFVVIKHKSVKSWNFRKKKKDVKIYLSKLLSMIYKCFSAFMEIRIFLLLPVFMANVHTVILLSTHTKYLSQEFVWPTRQWCADSQLPHTYQQIQNWPTAEGNIVPKI